MLIDCLKKLAKTCRLCRLNQLTSKAHKQLIICPKWVWKLVLESSYTQLYTNNKSPNLYNYLNTLNLIESDAKKLLSVCWVHTQLRHKVLNTNWTSRWLRNAWILKTLKLCYANITQTKDYNFLTWIDQLNVSLKTQVWTQYEKYAGSLTFENAIILWLRWISKTNYWLSRCD